MKPIGRWSVSTAVLAGTAMLSAVAGAPTRADAQGLFQGFWRPGPPAFRPMARDRLLPPTPTARSAAPRTPSLRQPAAAPVRASLLPAHSTGRVVLVVSTNLQKLTVYDDGVPVATTPVSTGVDDHPTPHGVFSIIAKEKFHKSNIYSQAPMPWMQRITWSGVALHEGHVTGRVASHGCVRLPAAFALELFRYTREGARVIIAQDDVVPSPRPALALFAPAATVQTPQETQVNVSADLEFDARPRGGPVGSTTGRPDFAASAPIHILVNRKLGKLFVRRASKPLFQVPIAIDDPLRPLGTHVFMASADADRSWFAMSLPSPIREARMSGGTRSLRDAPTLPLVASSAEDALARLRLAPGTAAYLGRLVAPGSTLILSDEGARNKEGQDYTNFIALTD